MIFVFGWFSSLIMIISRSCKFIFNFSYFSCVWLFAILWNIAHQAPLSKAFSPQAYWSGLPFLPPWYLPSTLLKNGINSFFFTAKYYSTLYMEYYFFIYSCFDRNLGCFHVLAILNIASVNIGVCVSFWLWFPPDVSPVMGLLDHKITLFLAL